MCVGRLGGIGLTQRGKFHGQLGRIRGTKKEQVKYEPILVEAVHGAENQLVKCDCSVLAPNSNVVGSRPTPPQQIDGRQWEQQKIMSCVRRATENVKH